MEWRGSFILLSILAVGCHARSSSQHPPPKSAESSTARESQSLTNILQLTTGFDRAGEAYFSPDMRWIIFQAVPRGEKNYQMYLSRLVYSDSGIVGSDNPIRITPPNSRNTCGHFSPDGRSLIFASTAGKEDPNEPSSGYQRGGSASGNYRWDFPKGMEIYRVDDWPAKVESRQPTVPLNLATHALTNNTAYDAECAHSPDDKWICFCSNRTGDLELYAMRPDGSDVVQLTHTKGYDGGPFFSPDGKRLLYRSDRVGNDLLQIYVADLVFDSNGKITALANEHQLTHDSNVNWGPYWHPDGRHIVYASSAMGHHNYELYLMRDDGTHNLRITYTPGFDGLPVFSPDGKYLMWSSKRSPDQTTQVFLANFRLPPGS